MVQNVFENVTKSSMLSDIAPQMTDELCSVNICSVEVTSTQPFQKTVHQNCILSSRIAVFWAGFGTGKKREIIPLSDIWGKNLILSRSCYGSGTDKNSVIAYCTMSQRSKKQKTFSYSLFQNV